MTEKQTLIEKNKEAIITALNAYLDKIYNLYETYFNENGSLKEGLTPDKKLESFIKDLKNNKAPIYIYLENKKSKKSGCIYSEEDGYTNLTINGINIQMSENKLYSNFVAVFCLDDIDLTIVSSSIQKDDMMNLLDSVTHNYSIK